MIMVYLDIRYTIDRLEKYAAGTSVIEQAFNSIRTVFAFSLQENFATEDYAGLRKGCDGESRRGQVIGLIRGAFDCLIFLIFAFSFWVWFLYVASNQLGGADAVTVILTMMIRKINTKSCVALLALMILLNRCSIG